MKPLDTYRKQIENIEIPDALNPLVIQTIKEHKMKEKKKQIIRWSTSVAAVLVFVIMINVNPILAESLSNIPLLGYAVKVSTFTHYQQNDQNYDMSIDVPLIEVDLPEEPTSDSQGKDMTKEVLGNNDQLNDVISQLNEKYYAEGQALYDSFIEETKALDLAGGGHMGVDSGYVVKTDDERFLSLGRYTVNTVASSSTVMAYDTIDKENAVLIKLPALFKDDTYITVINDFILKQMRENMNNDSSLVYWIEEDQMTSFTSISPDQNFYINEAHQLVIAFDKYEVAPGYMGLQEFVIPTETISSQLIDPTYLGLE